MSKPVCLVDPCLRVNPEALTLLRRLSGPLYVVAIFGPKGTGKSFLLDQLAGQEKGFGSAPGIWLQRLPHPTKPNENLLLLDTEGVPEQMEEEENDFFSRLFCLNVLLCDLFIYNTKGDEDPQKELDKLAYVAELDNKVQVLEDYALENSFLLNTVLPPFVWCLRDVASDTVWEEMLQASNHEMDVLLTSLAEDTPSSCVQKLFPSHKAFCFHSPHLNEIEKEALLDEPHPVFQRQLKAFKSYVLSKTQNRNISGEVLSEKLEQFVEALSWNQPILLDIICGGLQAASAWENSEDFLETTMELPKEEIPRTSHPSVWEPMVPQNPRTSPTTAQANDMEAPICLIENRPGEKLGVNQEALEILRKIKQPVVVVAIVGLYRTGKSYLMNKLAGKEQGGFSLGATIQANTKGIWMWCRPHPLKPDHTLVLLDTEGLGDVEKSNTENDSWIFALSVLLSSTFVYNSMSTINHYALEQMHYVTELTEHIKMKTPSRNRSESDNSFPDEFASFFPTFIWVVRDFTLQLALQDGRQITEDQYLENALERKTDAPEKQDLPKKCLREYFPNRKCFVFDRPASRHDLQFLEHLPESKLSPEFMEQARRFCNYIYENAQAKVIQGGHVVTGSSLGSLAESYTEAIRCGSIPCIENAVLALAQIENSAAVHEAVQRYEAMADLMLMMPTEDVEELLRVHSSCEKEAIQVFMNRSFKDEGQVFQEQLGNQLQSKLKELCRRNEQASSDRCQAVLMELFQDMEQKICDGSYSVRGGYQQFLNDQQNVVENYNMVAEKGLMAAKVLQDFLQAKEMVAQSILQTDQDLTEKQKEIEVAKARAEASEREAQLQREMKEKTQRMAQEMERSYEEHERYLIAKMEEDKRNLLAEQERLLNQKLQEQSRLQQEGFHHEYSRLQGEIQNLRSQISQTRQEPPCRIF
ncbi:guanylate-binding protein 3 [Pogona vitticeps]